MAEFHQQINLMPEVLTELGKRKTVRNLDSLYNKKNWGGSRLQHKNNRIIISLRRIPYTKKPLIYDRWQTLTSFNGEINSQKRMLRILFPYKYYSISRSINVLTSFTLVLIQCPIRAKNCAYHTSTEVIIQGVNNLFKPSGFTVLIRH